MRRPVLKLFFFLLAPQLILAGNPARMSNLWVKQVQTSHQTGRPAPAPHRATDPPDREVSPGEDSPLYDSDYDPVELGYPASLGVSLPPHVAKVQGSRAGLYSLTNLTRHYRPIWKQSPGKQWLFFSDAGHWMIGPNYTTNRGGLGSLESGLDLVPEAGWQYFTLATGKWREDAGITVSAPAPDPDILRVTTLGEGTPGSGRLGLYTKVEGEKHGRSVWRQRQGEGGMELGTSSLYYNCNGFWYLYNMLDFNDREGFFASTKDDLFSPPSYSWDFWSGVETILNIKDLSSAITASSGSSPERLLISSSTALSQQQEARLGVYVKTKDTRNSRPEWRQEAGARNTLYFDCNGFWFIWPEEEKDLEGFQLKAKDTLGLPLGEQDWRYWQGKGAHLKVSGVEVLPGSCNNGSSPCETPKVCEELWGGVTCRELSL